MKNTFIGLVAVLLALPALAGSPTYVTKSGSGTASTEVIFPAISGSQIRVVGVIGSSDLATSTFSFCAGDTAQVVTTATSSLTTSNIIVAATNGFAASDLIVISSPATNKTLTILGFPTATTIQCTAAVQFAQTVGMEVFHLCTPSTLLLGAITNKAYMGESVYSAPAGRPMRLVVNGTSICSVDVCNVHYDP